MLLIGEVLSECSALVRIEISLSVFAQLRDQILLSRRVKSSLFPIRMAFAESSAWYSGPESTRYAALGILSPDTQGVTNNPSPTTRETLAGKSHPEKIQGSISATCPHAAPSWISRCGQKCAKLFDRIDDETRNQNRLS